MFVFERLAVEWDLLLYPFGVIASFPNALGPDLQGFTDTCPPVLERAMIYPKQRPSF